MPASGEKRFGMREDSGESSWGWGWLQDDRFAVCVSILFSDKETRFSGGENLANVFRSARSGIAENILFLESPALAEAYSNYIDHVIAKYRA